MGTDNPREVFEEIDPYMNDGEPVVLVNDIDDLAMWDIEPSSVQIVEDDDE